jgi:repressor LexA
MAKGLTDRQQEVLEAIRTAIERQGFPPTIRELQTELGIGSLRGVTIHLDALERKGYISRTPAGRTETGRRPRASRSIRVLAPAVVSAGPEQEIAYLPLLGRIHPGTPLLAGPNIQEYLPIPRGILRGIEGCFIIRMSGDSMTGAHILAGDLVIARPAQKVENEELVAVRIGTEVTIKRYVRKGNRIDLYSQNPNYAPLPLRRGDDAAVVGAVVGLIRAC